MITQSHLDEWVKRGAKAELHRQVNERKYTLREVFKYDTSPQVVLDEIKKAEILIQEINVLLKELHRLGE